MERIDGESEDAEVRAATFAYKLALVYVMTVDNIRIFISGILDCRIYALEMVCWLLEEFVLIEVVREKRKMKAVIDEVFGPDAPAFWEACNTWKLFESVVLPNIGEARIKRQWLRLEGKLSQPPPFLLQETGGLADDEADLSFMHSKTMEGELGLETAFFETELCAPDLSMFNVSFFAHFSPKRNELIVSAANKELPQTLEEAHALVRRSLSHLALLAVPISPPPYTYNRMGACTMEKKKKAGRKKIHKKARGFRKLLPVGGCCTPSNTPTRPTYTLCSKPAVGAVPVLSWSP